MSYWVFASYRTKDGEFVSIRKHMRNLTAVQALFVELLDESKDEKSTFSFSVKQDTFVL